MYKKLRLLTTMLLLAVCCGTWADDTYVKITSTSELEVGAEYLFASETSSSDQRDNVMGAISTYGARVDLLKSGTTGTIVVSNNDKVNVITLGGSEGSWTFHTSIESKYVSWSSGNSLSVLDNANENSAQWTIQIASDGKATIANKGTSTRLLQYNSSSPRFACYTSSQTKFCLYKKQEGGSSTTETCANPSFSPVGGTYTSAQTVTLSCATDGASIYYRIDGTEPTADTTDGSLLYSSPITVDASMTIKAIAVKEGMENSAVADATYTIVNIEHAGTEADPYTVADARAAIDANTGITGVYATGIVSEIVTPYNSQYGNITYNISADGTTTADQLQAYRGKSYNGDNFTSADDIQVGDVVVIYGNLKKHNETYEFDANSQLVSLDRPVRPIINADDIEITYDATIGEITYTIENSIDGGALSASTTSDWLTLGTVGENVPFTCEANNTAAERTATVTLTYNYGDNETVTKNVTVTQTGNPNLVDDISDITEVGSSYKVRGTVVAINSRGFILGDGTGYVYVYENAAPTVAVDDMVTVEGTTGTYGNIIQFTSSASVTESTTSNYNGTPAATFITEVPDYSEGYHISTYFEYKGELTKTNGHYLITVGDQNIQISYPTTEQETALTALDGKLVHVKGYFSGINSSNYFTTMLESVEEVQLLDNEITGINETYTLDLVADDGISVLDLSNATATHGTVLFEVTSATMESTEYDLEGSELTVSAKGTIVIRAYVEANDEYNAAEKVITVTVLGAKDEAMVDVSDKTLECGGSYTLVENDDYLTDGEITMTSSNPLVASVDGLTVTAAAVGTATITVNAAEGTNYAALVTPATFTVTVTSPIGLEEAPSTEAVVLLNESFSESTGSLTEFGGNDGNGTIKYDGSEWFVSNAYGANGSAKFGASSKKGSATTPELTVVSGETYNLTFKAAPWASESTTMNVTVEGGTITGISTDAMTTGKWNEYSATITASSTSMSVTFEASKNRFFLDDVKIEKPAEAVVAPKLTLSASGYASYCCEYPLDFTNIDNDTFKAWYVSAVDMTSGDVTFSEITGTIKGGEAFFLYGTPGAECQLAYAESSSVVLNGNKLVGTLAPTYVENGNGIQNYGLSGGKFVKMGNGVVKANKSYLPVEVGTETPARLNIIFESQEATGIMNVSREGTTDNRYYNLNGQRVMNPTKGMYIVNGKKVIIK